MHLVTYAHNLSFSPGFSPVYRLSLLRETVSTVSAFLPEPAQQRRDACVHDLALVRDARWSNNVVLHIYVQLTVLDEQRKKRRDVARVELARVHRNRRRQVRRRENRDA